MCTDKDKKIRVSVQGGEENARQDLRGLQNGALSTTLNGRQLTLQAKLWPKPRRSERLQIRENPFHLRVSVCYLCLFW